jgi:Zn-dependent metalloprotease
MKTHVLHVLCMVLMANQLMAQSRIIEKARDAFGSEVTIERDKVTAGAIRVHNLGVSLAGYGLTTQSVDRSNIASIAARIVDDYTGITAMASKDLVLQKAEARHGVWFVSYMQTYRDIPVWRTELGFTIENTGAVHTLGGKTYPTVSLPSIVPQLSSQEAEVIAISRFNQSWLDSRGRSDSVSLVVYPQTADSMAGFKLAWQVFVSESGPVAKILYIIDAHDGGILFEENQICDGGTITTNTYIDYWPLHHYDTPTREAGLQSVQVRVYNTLGQECGNGYSNSSGNWVSPFLSTAAYYVRRTYGLNALSSTYAAIQNGNSIDENTSYMIPPTTNNRDFVNQESNAFHHVNVMHNYYTSSPFDYDAMNYQTIIHMNDGANTNGASDGFDLYFGSYNGQLWAGAADVIYHEYTHSTIHHLYGQWIGSDEYEEGKAMDEGLSDYFASAKTNDPVLGESVGGSRTCDNSYTMDDFNVITDNGVTGAHANGQIISGACWNLRQALSGTDLLVFQALERTPHATNFSDFADNIVYSDDDDGNPNNGTPHLETIRAKFYTKKIYFDAGPPQAPQSFTVTSPDYSSPLLTWSAPPESDVASGGHVIVQRRYKWGGQPIHSWSSWSTIATLAGTATQYTDALWDQSGAGPDSLQYRIQAEDVAGNFSAFSNVATMLYNHAAQKEAETPQAAAKPDRYDLRQNYPNPFNPSTSITFALPTVGNVSLIVYDVRGGEITTMVDRTLDAGYHTAIWNASSVASGVYFARLTVTNDFGKVAFNKVTKLLLMK